MKVDKLLEVARAQVQSWAAPSSPHTLAKGVVELLDQPAPCGWQPMRVRGETVYWEGVGQLTVDEARGIAVALLAAADEADR